MLEKNAQIILGKLIKVHQKKNVKESLREGEGLERAFMFFEGMEMRVVGR
jgi:hypothetical protein